MKRLLLVDDDPAAVDALHTLLELDGYDVVALESSPLALERVRAEPFDAVITDLEMPFVHGVEIVRAAHEVRPEMAVVVVTAYAGSPACDTAVALGVRAVLPKPLQYQALCDVLHHALGDVAPSIIGPAGVIPSSR